ncbi:MAG: helix-turn-helix transcriptional regulator [Clostridia bacterium]|nr:helix-turn-helix transcriptional regulator [Clostridia bacterium]
MADPAGKTGLAQTVRELRIAKKMTQREVCGDRITRNMLSIIENGNANPSLSTLNYLAERLRVSPGYLICSEDEKYLFRRAEAAPGIYQSLRAGDYALCKSICEGLGRSDPEIDRIILECDFGIAKDLFARGCLRQASSAFAGVYRRDSEKRFASLCSAYSACITDISPSLDNDVPAAEDFPQSLCEDFTLYYFCLKNSSKKEDRLRRIAESYPGYRQAPEYYRKHIRGRLLMSEDRFGDAAAVIREGADSSPELPLPAIFFMFEDLENCCRLTGDLKSAYEYSGIRRELFERFLR